MAAFGVSPEPMALTAEPISTVDARVGLGVLVSPFAVRSAGVVSRKPVAAHDVLSLCHGFKVGRIHAALNAAQMVKFEAIRDGSDDVFVRPAVGGDRPVAKAQAELPVAVDLGACPKPASFRFLDESPEPFLFGHGQLGTFVDRGVAVAANPVVVGFTKGPLQSVGGAVTARNAASGGGWDVRVQDFKGCHDPQCSTRHTVTATVAVGG